MWCSQHVSDAIVLRLTHPTLPPGRVEGFSFHSRNAASGIDIVFDRLDVSPVVYIYGVAKGPEDQRRHRNLHLPVRDTPGAIASATTYNGYSIELRNATILEVPAVPDGWRGLPLRHTRCKNFRFGLAHFGAKA